MSKITEGDLCVLFKRDMSLILPVGKRTKSSSPFYKSGIVIKDLRDIGDATLMKSDHYTAWKKWYYVMFGDGNLYYVREDALKKYS